MSYGGFIRSPLQPLPCCPSHCPAAPAIHGDFCGVLLNLGPPGSALPLGHHHKQAKKGTKNTATGSCCPLIAVVATQDCTGWLNPPAGQDLKAWGGRAVPTSPHSPVTQRGGGQRRRLHLMLVGGLAASWHWAVGRVTLWSPLLHRTMRWRKPGPQLGVHCRDRGHGQGGWKGGDRGSSGSPRAAPTFPELQHSRTVLSMGIISDWHCPTEQCPQRGEG